MSKPYILRVSETVRRHIVVEDGIETRLDLLDILPCEDLDRLLEEELKEKGFTVENGVATKTESDGLTIKVDIEKRQVHVGMRDEREVEHTVDRKERSMQQNVDEGMRERARKDAHREIDSMAERRRREMTDAIEKRLGDVRAELDEVVVKVTQKALRKRASQIGEIQSVEEDAATGSMTIRVRV